MADEVASKDTVNVNRNDYDAMRDRINELEDDGTSDIYDTLNKPVNKTGWLWVAPEYFSRWRIFPRCFISMYIYLLYEVTMWFMALSEPNMAQAGLVSVVVGAGAAWFGLYVTVQAQIKMLLVINRYNSNMDIILLRQVKKDRIPPWLQLQLQM